MNTCKALRLAEVTQKALDMCLLFFTVYRKSLTESTPSLVLRARNHTPPLSTRRLGSWSQSLGGFQGGEFQGRTPSRISAS